MNAKPAPSPAKIQPISVDDLARLGIDDKDRLYWDDRPVEIRRRLKLTWVQNAVAVIVTLAAIASGAGAMASGLQDGSEFLCARHIHWLGCPITAGMETAR